MTPAHVVYSFVVLAIAGFALVRQAGAARAVDGCLPTTEWVDATVPVGENPSSVAVDPAHGRAYVTNRGSGTISVLDTRSLSVEATWEVGSDPVALAVNSTGSLVHVIRRQNVQSELLIMDGVTGAVQRSKVLDIVAADLAVHPSGRMVYVVGWDGGHILGGESSNGAIMAIESSTGRLAASRLLGGRFLRYQAVFVSPVDGRVLATWTHRYGRNGLETFDGLNLDRIGELSPSGDNAFTGLAIDATGRRLLLATTWQWINVVDSDLPIRRPRGPVEGDLLLGQVDAGRPSRMVLDEETKILYVTRWPLDEAGETSRELVIVDARSLQVLGTVPIGPGRHSIALDPTTHRIFVTSSTDGTVSVIQGIAPDAGC